MARYLRRAPIRDLERVLEEAVFRPWGMVRRGDGVGSVPVDIYETDDGYIVKAPMPGVTPENLEITYEAGVLTVRGEAPEEKEVAGECICQERRFGRFARSVNLPGDVVGDKIDATLKNGVLTLSVPKAEEAKPRKINVKIG